MSIQVTPLTSSSKEQTKKIYYIDYLKVVVTTLVVLHHTLITYGAPGGWYYTQKTSVVAAISLMTVFVTINQSFFMGFFFFLSAYFIPTSYRKKGAARFVKDRLIRLGIPLIFYSFMLSPILSYLIYFFAQGNHVTLAQYLGGFDDWIDFGVLWFVAALLLFTLVYVVWQQIRGNTDDQLVLPAPSVRLILLVATCVGVLSFLVRTVFPVGWVLRPVGFQLGYFSQYIVLFILGLLASKYGWLHQLDYSMGKRFLRYALRLLLFFPLFFVMQKVLHLPQDGFTGGWRWQQLLFAVWEQVLGFCIVVALLSIGRQKWNSPSSWITKLSRYTFAVYIFHPLVLISLALAFRNWPIEPALKLLFVAPLAVSCSFLLASVVTRIPGVNRVI
jgi:surface polysaccharide O-acyltransferase-like enzyme